ncbi:LysR family transcriptional regulator [Aeromonas dhakensis]|uniref:LysR family transcriptional regulator n=1 Tax=Aeromonas TaxID=642 RepID=UPI0005BBBAB2|nr:MULTISPECIES: LysR family transcriptional regulator [Aeromonas]MDD9308555.1 LysR family transcriptional regulator [Aeromonas hydrophila]EIM1710029.1 LysR family transcriptional regulator [Aeromonas dhakensis]MBL0461613.1 LysR family transcriptional regulator [Aeromonas dhakensis]MBL0601983.1 LysR family transcriptional regulator [Aeromonas dhakensis]MBL0619639.1 LysR family transcriptional regulator [Aeromonas dhakensis]
MNPSLEQLRVLLAAAQAGSFSAAARQLGKAQSVVSTAIANLEIDLGLELFDRSGRYPVLTEAGVRISQEAGILLAQSARLQAIAGELASGVESRLTLAIDDDSHLPWLGAVLEEFATHYPTVELELLFPLMEDLTEMLISGRAQLGISYQKENPQQEIVARSLGGVAMPLVVSPEHPLAHKAPLRESDLQGARQLLVTGRREGTERHRFRLSAQVWWVEGDLGILELVKLGLGWAAVPDFLLHRPLARGEVVVLKPDFITQPELALELQWHRARPLGQAGRWLKEALLARVR